jgi:2-desacetyl-2-hydroxyethyl bacteriochlorophyllide A dehydrogenase
MKVVVSEDRTVRLEERDIPEIKDNYVLIKTKYSVISPGTELSQIERSNGRKICLGYSAMGEAVEVGEGVNQIIKGDYVACYGAPYVQHAEYLLVPKTLCCKIPDHIDPRAAALGGLGAIAIHALRTAKLQFGEWALVVGLGILGQLISQIAHASLYRVIPYDVSEARAEIFQQTTGIPAFTSLQDLERVIEKETKGHGVDAVLLCAGGKYSSLTHDSLNWVRDRGKVVIVGDIEPVFPRDQMFAKEVQILISRAGGPGRYDPFFEKKAIDYPYGFIRWTEGRNVEEFIRIVSERRINVSPYLTEVVELDQIEDAYAELVNKQSPVLTKIIKYE